MGFIYLKKHKLLQQHPSLCYIGLTGKLKMYKNITQSTKKGYLGFYFVCLHREKNTF